jgi:signal transduction histidine kinase
MLRRRSPWPSREGLLGAVAGGSAAVAAWMALGRAGRSAPLLAGLGLIFIGYLYGVVLASRKREATDARDLLELREELRFSQDHIMENETYRSLGAYLEIAAHQMKEPLQKLTTDVRALSADTSLPEHARASVGALRGQVEALQAVLRHLAAYSMTKPGRAPFSVNTLLHEAILLCRRRAAEKKIVIEERYDTVPPVMGSAGRVHQAIFNVIVNAIEAMPFGGGTIGVTTAHENDRVIARVRDSGIGIRPEHLPKVFEPFFTTKPEKKGIGLGLWTARQMLDIIGADISVKSAPFQGTEVTLSFPQAAPLRPGREGVEHPPELSRNTAEERNRQIA